VGSGGSAQDLTDDAGLVSAADLANPGMADCAVLSAELTDPVPVIAA